VSSIAFTYSEAKLSDRLGISRADIKSFRDGQLRPALDWKKLAGEVVLSAVGVKKLWRALESRPARFDLAACLISSPGQKDGVPVNGDSATEILLGSALMPIPAMMTVTRICPNQRLVLAQQTEGLDRRTQPVWVGRNENFVMGMRIKCAPKPNAPGMWRFMGVLPQRRYTPDEWSRRQKAGLQG
jgi:hypothetical protein